MHWSDCGVVLWSDAELSIAIPLDDLSHFIGKSSSYRFALALRKFNAPFRAAGNIIVRPLQVYWIRAW